MQRAAVLTLQRLSRIWVAPIRAPRDIVERRRHQPSATLVRRRFANSHTIACTISIWTAFARRDCRNVRQSNLRAGAVSCRIHTRCHSARTHSA